MDYVTPTDNNHLRCALIGVYLIEQLDHFLCAGFYNIFHQQVSFVFKKEIENDSTILRVSKL